MDEQRLIDIETRLAHQDRLLSDLDAALGSQQSQLLRLEQLCQSLLERIRSMADSAPTTAAGDERPPHY
ncbi:MAG: SlyX family protein [Woeseiaceae bacterium]